MRATKRIAHAALVVVPVGKSRSVWPAVGRPSQQGVGLGWLAGWGKSGRILAVQVPNMGLPGAYRSGVGLGACGAGGTGGTLCPAETPCVTYLPFLQCCQHVPLTAFACVCTCR